ncbi:MAG: hypothetical protein ORN57_01305, partial [Alphaproteobacteria bacterium]|nr:hypothetical protein [Alphaproteobacteria bacterium]
ITQSVVANSFATELLDGNAAAFATATGKIIGVSSSTVVNDFAAAGVSALRIIVGPTTTTPILGISQLQGLSNAIQSPVVGGVDIPIGQNTDGNKLFVIDVNSPGSITLSDVVAGQSQGSYIFGDIFHYQPIVGHLSGAPTLLVNIVASQQATADNNDAVMVSTQTQTRTRTIDQTTHFNVLETIDINAQLDKTEMTASRHTSEIITTAYDQLIATTTLSRTIVDSKEIYVPITLGVNYSLTLGRSDFGFIVGVDAGAWLHNISRQYYFSGGGGQIMGVTETAIKNYNESKNIYHYNMTTAAVTVNQKITEIKNSFKSYDRATLITSNLGTMSLVGDIGLNSTASFIYNSSNNTLLLGLLGVNNAADLNGRLAVRTTTDMNNNGTISTGVGISLLHDLGFTTASQTGVLSHVKLIFADGNTPTITIVHGTTASSISQQSWTRTSNFVATVSATSTLGTITMNAITSSMVEGVAGVSAVVSA